MTAALREAGTRVDTVARGTASRTNGGTPGLCFDGIDASRLDSIEPVMHSVFTRTGRLDGLINCAGGFRWLPLEEIALETRDELYRNNLRTAATAGASALPYLLKSGRGSIVNVGALVAVTVNAVLPGILDTPRNRADLPDADFSLRVAPRAVAGRL